MYWDRLNRWIVLFANLGVLVGLIVLVVEVRHAISLTEQEAYRNRGTEIQEAMQNLAMSPELADIIAKSQEQGVGALLPSEKVRLNAWYGAMLRRMQNQFNDHRLGYLDEMSNENMLRAAKLVIPIYQELGNNNALQLHPEFVEAVESSNCLRC